jgi:hypothetical protein
VAGKELRADLEAAQVGRDEDDAAVPHFGRFDVFPAADLDHLFEEFMLRAQ